MDHFQCSNWCPWFSTKYFPRCHGKHWWCSISQECSPTVTKIFSQSAGTFFFKNCSLFYFWLCWVSVAACRLALVASFWLRWLLLSWSTGLFALWHMGSSQTRNRTGVPCIGRWILIHWITREVLCFLVLPHGIHRINIFTHSNLCSTTLFPWLPKYSISFFVSLLKHTATFFETSKLNYSWHITLY